MAKGAESLTAAVRRLHDHGWSTTFEGKAVEYFPTSYASPMPWWAPGVGRKRTSQITVTPTREQLESLFLGFSGPQAERAGAHAVVDTADRRAVCGKRVLCPPGEFERSYVKEVTADTVDIHGLPICETCKKLTGV